jgi:long-chain acyl-CoA synthetase
MKIKTLNELFFRAAEEHDKPNAFLAKSKGAYRPFSHRETLRAVEELSLGLSSLGVEAGDRVAIFSENRLEWALADYAILTAGAVNVPIYSTLPHSQVEHILKDSEARVVFVSTPDLMSRIGAIRSGLRPDLKVVTFDSFASEAGGSTPLEELRRKGREMAGAQPHLHRDRAGWVTEDALASIIYTSGTTGVPKGVMLTHGNIVSNIEAALAVLPIGPTDSCLSFLPLCHIFERMAGHYTMFLAGATIAYAESVESVPQNLLEVRPTLLLSVPRLYEKMHARVMEAVSQSPPLRQKLFRWAVDVGRRRSLALLSHRPVSLGLEVQYAVASRLVFAKLKARTGGRIRYMVSGGAPLNPDIALFFHGAGLVILEGYGLTETSPVISCNRLDATKIGTVGQPIPGVEVRTAEDGEILVKGPGVMKGYYKMPEATAETLKDGWFRTGDIGVLDGGGFLTITDRKKDLIVTAGGKNVAPQPIENRLKSDKYIAEAVLIGDKRPHIVCLVVPDFAAVEAWTKEQGIVSDRASLCRDQRLIALLMERVNAVNRDLAPFEQIKRIGLIDRDLTVDQGDLTPTLKVKRRVLSQNFESLIESLYSHPSTPTSHRTDEVEVGG